MCSIHCTTITGEFWSYRSPPIYNLKYFEFLAATGGGVAYLPASIDFNFIASNAADFIDSVLEIRKSYPFSSFSITNGTPTGMKMSIFSYQLFDFDFRFALEIENTIHALIQK